MKWFFLFLSFAGLFASVLHIGKCDFSSADCCHPILYNLFWLIILIISAFVAIASANSVLQMPQGQNTAQSVQQEQK